jgi:hypothetical protein
MLILLKKLLTVTDNSEKKDNAQKKPLLCDDDCGLG